MYTVSQASTSTAASFSLTTAQRAALDALPFALTIAHIPSAFIRATVNLDASDMPAGAGVVVLGRMARGQP